MACAATPFACPLRELIFDPFPMSRQIAIYPTALKVEQLLRELSRERSGNRAVKRIMTLPELVDALWRGRGQLPCSYRRSRSGRCWRR